MNEPTTPTPNLESAAESEAPAKSNAEISHSVAPVSNQNPGISNESKAESVPGNPPQPDQPGPIAQEKPAVQTTSTETDSSVSNPSSAASSSEGKRVLIIEDEKFISDLYTRALIKEGYKVDSENDGKLALEKARTGNYDIILLDIMLPSMNGIDLLHTIKNAETPGETIDSKVIITTNMDQPDDVKSSVEKIADGYLIKAEITPKELVNFIKQL